MFPDVGYNINEHNDNNFLEKSNLAEYKQKYYFQGNCLYLL
jgi:hypothetical protein